MHAVDIIILILIAAAAVFAVRSIRKQKKSGKCCGGSSSGCSGNCVTCIHSCSRANPAEDAGSVRRRETRERIR
ncbi:MAG: FeoB-associated Cys-rich membrane protein [Bilifractor sp.]|jgi:hypothetical protein